MRKGIDKKNYTAAEKKKRFYFVISANRNQLLKHNNLESEDEKSFVHCCIAHC